MKRMLFNATHAEELRVAIVDGQKLSDIDIETAGKESRQSNIYKGVSTRIEPSLEACFVNYGEERHGFLPFKEVARTYFKEGVDVRNASIKEALREGQELLVQMEKEERGNKGAALTTFISLAGRYLVLMPNNPKGGGVSRRIEGENREELRDLIDQLQVPQGGSVIARTAAIDRSLEELQWDLNYMLQLWKAIDEASKAQPGAYLIYQESSLVIRAIRDYFTPDIGEILIDTDDICDQAKQFMSHVMPDMVNRVKRYRDDIPLFSRFQIEHQIETAYSRTVPLPSGGSIVIDHTEALVAVDVNSARATKGSDIEQTATRTNIEAAEEVARQLRLRDLGGLIVIDFIDMEEGKNQKAVEQTLRDSLHSDRARVQMGKISRFGLMELSRQRLRPALNEGSHTTCPRCNGTGVIRDTESSALHILRIIQEEAMKDNTAAVYAQVPVDVATFLLNEKRVDIAKLEARMKVNVLLVPNKHIETPHYTLERLRHDDPRLEDMGASYTLPDAPVQEDVLFGQKDKDEKPRQIAMVKGITPDQPAPIRPPVAEPVAAPVSAAPSQRTYTPAAEKPGFFSRLFGFFRSEEKPAQAPAATVASQSATAASTTAERPAREGRDGNRGRRGGRDRGDRNQDQRGNRRDGERKSEPRSDRKDQRAAGDVTRTAMATQPEGVSALETTDRPNEQRQGRQRGGRPERGDRNTQRAPLAGTTPEELAALAPVMNGASAQEQLPERPDAESQESSTDPARKSRRRRGRRRGDKREESAGVDTQAPQSAAPETSATLQPMYAATQELPTQAATPYVAAAFADTIPVRIETPVFTAPAPAAPVLAPQPTQIAPPPPAPAYRAPQVRIDIKPVPLDTSKLEIVVQGAGLSWVHTDQERHAKVQASIQAVPRAPRMPRERK
ncbi:MAG: Rne/Rng family ribonuclease, partial [Burkholderiaceae bacterium]